MSGERWEQDNDRPKVFFREEPVSGPHGKWSAMVEDSQGWKVVGVIKWGGPRCLYKFFPEPAKRDTLWCDTDTMSAIANMMLEENALARSAQQ